LIKIDARGARFESSVLIPRRHLDMRLPVVTSGSRLENAPLDSQPVVLLLSRQMQHVMLSIVNSVEMRRSFWGVPSLALGLQSRKVIAT